MPYIVLLKFSNPKSKTLYNALNTRQISNECTPFTCGRGIPKNTINSHIGGTTHTQPLAHHLQTLHLPWNLNVLDFTEFLARFVQFVHLYRPFDGYTQTGDGGALQAVSGSPHTKQLTAAGLRDLNRVRIGTIQARLVQQLDVLLFTCKSTTPDVRLSKKFTCTCQQHLTSCLRKC